jgi:hypothetical protein
MEGGGLIKPNERQLGDLIDKLALHNAALAGGVPFSVSRVSPVISICVDSGLE